MSSDRELIEALLRVVQLDPANIPIRTQLCELYLKAEEGPEALKLAQGLLNESPDQLSLLDLAARACDLSGDSARATSYRRMAEALGSQMLGRDEPVREDPEPKPAGPAHRPPAAKAPIADSGFSGPDPLSGNNRAKPPADLDRWLVSTSDLRLSHVAGLEKAKERLHLSFLGPLQNSDLRKAFGHTARGGLLLYGPPGCGKTFLAKAIAGELGAGFLNVGISEVMDMWYGNSEKFLHDAFQAARYQQPCVLFFDEVDALARNRSSFAGQAGRSLVNQLLSEMDGVDSQNDGVYLLAATNHPWDLDSAVRRPGRLDRMLFVPPPDRGARAQIAAQTLEKIPHEKLDIDWIADKTENYSGADVVHLCRSAAELALQDSMKSSTVRPVETRHIKDALKDIRPSMKSWFDSARNYAQFANESGEYDDLREYLKAKKWL